MTVLNIPRVNNFMAAPLHEMQIPCMSRASFYMHLSQILTYLTYLLILSMNLR